MSEPVIDVDSVSKLYRIGSGGQKRERYKTLREALTKPFSKQSKQPAGDETLLWALKDVSFQVNQGEVVAIIGRNGAGKSTLLKILTRITDPTEGRIAIRGRVGSLLEVGTGFHPELTGRENVYMNGAILGMTRAEVRRRFDEIVEFAEVARFIDTPVKHYSSGMYMRLAFGVAAHLEPEILIVDEVLAVGDAAFQRKCLGKMEDTAKHGRTVLFVSHNMDAVRRLCSQGVWLDAGQVRMLGTAADCVTSYALREIAQGAQRTFDPPLRFGNELPAVLHKVELRSNEGKPSDHFSTRSALVVHMEWEAMQSLYKPRFGFILQTADGQDVMTALDAESWKSERIGPGRRSSSCTVPGGLFNEGDYMLDFACDSPPGHGLVPSRTGALLRFTLEDDMTLPNKYYGQEGFRDARWPGMLLLNLPWRQQEVASNGTGTIVGAELNPLSSQAV